MHERAASSGKRGFLKTIVNYSDGGPLRCKKVSQVAQNSVISPLDSGFCPIEPDFIHPSWSTAQAELVREPRLQNLMETPPGAQVEPHAKTQPVKISAPSISRAAELGGNCGNREERRGRSRPKNRLSRLMWLQLKRRGVEQHIYEGSYTRLSRYPLQRLQKVNGSGRLKVLVRRRRSRSSCFSCFCAL